MPVKINVTYHKSNKIINQIDNVPNEPYIEPIEDKTIKKNSGNKPLVTITNYSPHRSTQPTELKRFSRSKNL